MIPVLWSVDSLDWTTENVSEIVDRVVTKTRENDMILMHDCYESSVKAAFQIIDHYVFTNGHLHAGSGSLQHRG